MALPRSSASAIQQRSSKLNPDSPNSRNRTRDVGSGRTMGSSLGHGQEQVAHLIHIRSIGHGDPQANSLVNRGPPALVDESRIGDGGVGNRDLDVVTRQIRVLRSPICVTMPRLFPSMSTM